MIPSLGMKLPAYENFLKDYLHVALTSPPLFALLPASSSDGRYHLRLSATAGAAYSELTRLASVSV
jgi:hypothetical protein